MAAFVWKEGFNTGIGEIDRQHRLFLEYLNQCNEYALSQNKEKVIPELILKMKDYALMHFEFEENLMKSVNFAGFAQHEAQHEYFDAQVAELEEAIKNGVNEKAVSLAAFMRDWLVSHILEEDKLYTPLLTKTSH